eukprot:COSAG02_NODE_4441_length_5354_cov_3.167650_7_plen_141_part_00
MRKLQGGIQIAFGNVAAQRARTGPCRQGRTRTAPPQNTRTVTCRLRPPRIRAAAAAAPRAGLAIDTSNVIRSHDPRGPRTRHVPRRAVEAGEQAHARGATSNHAFFTHLGLDTQVRGLVRVKVLENADSLKLQHKGEDVN